MIGIQSQLHWEELQSLDVVRLYADDIHPRAEYEGLIGLSLTRNDHRHIRHDITYTMPLPDNSIDSYQAEDVFEHIAYEKLVGVINEIYRVLKPGGLFRLSLPDYGCDVLWNRSVKDGSGQLAFDPEGGGTPDNPGHLWFPRIDSVKRLLEETMFSESGTIEFLHYYNMDGTFVIKPIDYTKGHIMRTPDFDERVKKPYRPMSLVVDLIKGNQTLADRSSSQLQAEHKPTSQSIQENNSGLDIQIIGTEYGGWAVALDHIDSKRMQCSREAPVSLLHCKGQRESRSSIALRNDKGHYGKEYFDYQKDVGKFGGMANLFKFDRLINTGDTVVDFGCGGGYLLGNIQCKEKIGIEINPHARQEAESNGIKAVESIEMVPDDYADALISNHALEHVLNPLEVLKKLKKKLKSGGRIVFVVPHQDTTEEYNPTDRNKHLYTWNQLTLGNLFVEAGYSVLGVEAFQHQWPPDYLDIYSQYGEDEFHRRSKSYAVKNNNYQIRMVATKA